MLVSYALVKRPWVFQAIIIHVMLSQAQDRVSEVEQSLNVLRKSLLM
jgi:hypothetical protein